jgi:hypothetical protein
MQLECAICGENLEDSDFARNYPGFVCRKCDARAVNARGEKPHHESMYDSGDNPVFIDGLKCWRRYRYGGYVTMRDKYDCADIGEFYEKAGAIF